MARLLIAGDTCPIGRNQPLFLNGDASALLGDLQPEFEQADLRIINLECPLVSEQTPVEKVGPNLGVPVECVHGLKAMGVDVAGLANNHILDHGPNGLRTTIKALEEHGIAYVGAGENIDEARKVLVREVNGIRVGILALAEHEFNIAKRNLPGANPLDVIDFVRNIQKHRREFDKLVILLHGGSLHNPYPSPGLIDTCRFLVEQGACAVICQHSHCVGCMEIYQGAPIIYGQGNFIFDELSRASTWHEGLLVHLDISTDGTIKTHLTPYRNTVDRSGVQTLQDEERNKFMERFDKRCVSILDPDFVELKWNEACRKNRRYYLHMLHGKPGLFRRLAGKLDLLHLLDSQAVFRQRLHIIRCESHREMLITVLYKMIRKE